MQTKRKMKVLVVTDNRFWRQHLGSHKRIGSMIDNLKLNNFETTVMFAGWIYPEDEDTYSSACADCHIHPFGRSGHQPANSASVRTNPSMFRFRQFARQLIFETHRWATRLTRRRTKLPTYRRFSLQTKEPKIRDYKRQETAALFDQIIKKHDPDIVIVEYVRLAWLLENASMRDDTLKIIDTHDVQYDRQSRFHQNNQIHDIDITPEEEADALALADWVLAIQSSDAEKLEALAPGKTLVVGYPSEIRKHQMPTAEVVSLGFFGSKMLPNREAVNVIIDEILPLLDTLTTSPYEINIFGGVCEYFTDAALPERIRLRGFVDSIDDAYNETSIILNPVRFGGGLKIKNVEALCNGKALITTSIGAEGIDDKSRQAFVVADSATEIARMLSTLINSFEARKQLSERSLEFAKANFSHEAVYAPLNRILKKHR